MPNSFHLEQSSTRADMHGAIALSVLLVLDIFYFQANCFLNYASARLALGLWCFDKNIGYVDGIDISDNNLHILLSWSPFEIPKELGQSKDFLPLIPTASTWPRLASLHSALPASKQTYGTKLRYSKARNQDSFSFCPGLRLWILHI